jgi:hypothetical protein
MRHPKELSEADLLQITQKLRERLNQLYGPGRVTKFLSSDKPLVYKFLTQTYILVREKLEEELAGSDNS